MLAPIGHHINECFLIFQRSGLVDRINSVKAVLPQSMADFEAFYCKSDLVDEPDKLQRAIWFQLMRDTFDALLNAAPPSDRVRLLSCTTPFSSTWLSTLPLSNRLVLDDNTARIAVALRLNVSPFYYDPAGAPIRCPFASLSARVCQQVDMRKDFAHGVSCVFENKVGRSFMHDNVLASVLEIARHCRLRPHHLPKGYFAVDNTGIKIDNKQPDGLVDFGDLDGSVLFDVRGVCPTSQSSLALNAADHTKTMQNAADDKSSKYLTVAEQRAVGFVPFVFNTYGGLHFSAQRFVDKMIGKYRAHVNDDKATALKYNSLSALCISIMRDNAEIIGRAHNRSALM